MLTLSHVYFLAYLVLPSGWVNVFVPIEFPSVEICELHRTKFAEGSLFVPKNTIIVTQCKEGPTMPVSRIFQITNAYESGVGHGSKKDGHSESPYADPELGEAYKLGYKHGETISPLNTHLPLDKSTLKS